MAIMPSNRRSDQWIGNPLRHTVPAEARRVVSAGSGIRQQIDGFALLGTHAATSPLVANESIGLIFDLEPT
jgi:hypothetical protein